MKQLIVDYLPFEVGPEQITESMKENNGKLIVRGVLQRAEAKNQNGRIYPKEVLVREAKKYYKEFIKQSRAMGELDHPESAVVNLQNVSHNIKEMHWEGNNLTELFKSGIKLGISSRGMGSVETVSEAGEQSQEVQPDFELIAFDFVSNPSTQGAFMYPMNESVNKEFSTGRTCGVYCKVESIVNDIMRGA